MGIVPGARDGHRRGLLGGAAGVRRQATGREGGEFLIPVQAGAVRRAEHGVERRRR